MTSIAANALHGLNSLSLTQIDQFTAPSSAPAEITSFTTEVLSAAVCINQLISLLDQYDGFIVACFSDHPLVEMLREHTDKPVVGIMQASLIHATLLGNRFGIVTTNKEWEFLLNKSIHNMALDHRCGGIKATNISPVGLELAGKDVINVAMSEAAGELVKNNGCDIIILGCAGMSGLKETMQQACLTMGLKASIIDPVVAGYEVLSGLIGAQKA
ncbi:unnamed protein product [Adineta ricciae]|uniref:Hydantoin racemase n=1 Tax=Adineta ricciae TaxID=249248 RepID=A0A814Y4P2_ADIRI|nr:unnamed protein product [Adineta ricciae]CAF1437601.1 unnamed protein product [Adineta ricciae]